MPTQFTTGAQSQADAASVGLAMMNIIRDDVALHPAWNVFDEFTPTAGGMHWVVLKCLAFSADATPVALSGLPFDFYVIMGRNPSSGQLYAFCAEAYDPATKIVSKYSAHNGSSTITYDTKGQSPATFTLGSSTSMGTTYPSPKTLYWTPNSGSTKYWITVDNDTFS